MKRKTTIISAFPACGKTYICNSPEFAHLRCADSDSSEFSWVYSMQPGLGGGYEKVRNPEFPRNYIDHIQRCANSGCYDFIFVSSHEKVRSMMDQMGIEYAIVYPSEDRLEEWVDRCKARGNDDTFIQTLRDNWMDWIYGMKICTGEHLHYELKSGEFLSSCLEELRC